MRQMKKRERMDEREEQSDAGRDEAKRNKE